MGWFQTSTSCLVVLWRQSNDARDDQESECPGIDKLQSILDMQRLIKNVIRLVKVRIKILPCI